MTRRLIGLLVTLALGFLAIPIIAVAQPRVKIPVIGVLRPRHASADAAPNSTLSAFRQALRDLGWVEGHKVAIESRYAEGHMDRLTTLAAELVRLPVEVLVTGGTEEVAAAKHVTQSIPIVIMRVGDPVQRGFVVSLARPEGNITGVSNVVDDVIGKELELLKEIVPRLSRVAVLWNPPQPAHPRLLKALEGMARSVGIQLHPVVVHRAEEFEDAFVAMHAAGADALMIFASTVHSHHVRRIADLALQHRLPAMTWGRAFAENGLLMTYGPSERDIARRAAYYVDRILKGAKPADLPVEQPTKFELVINLKTAQALGVIIPSSLLFQADEVIRRAGTPGAPATRFILQMKSFKSLESILGHTR